MLVSDLPNEVIEDASQIMDAVPYREGEVFGYGGVPHAECDQIRIVAFLGDEAIFAIPDAPLNGCDLSEVFLCAQKLPSNAADGVPHAL
jgi:hypothetical protein